MLKMKEPTASHIDALSKPPLTCNSLQTTLGEVRTMRDE